MTPPIPEWTFRQLDALAAPLGGEAAPIPKVIGRYRLLHELARGGMGVVYEAEDTELRRPVAVKILIEAPGEREQLKPRFRREAQAAAGVDHPNVIRVYDSGEHQGVFYIVMELVRGRPLRDLILERGHDLAWMLRLLERAARGIAAAHAAGVLHRDVKPSNIIVSEGGEPKVGDFGLARLEDGGDLTRSGTPMGTPMYMSPEQVMGRGNLTPATDVYSLGAILYEMSTGRPPHVGETSAEIYTRVLSQDPPRPRSLAPRTPADVETICLKALEREPSRRYRHAGEFADDLRRHLDGEAILARPPGLATRAVKWVRRHRLAASVAAIGAASILVIAGLQLGAASRERAKRDGFLAVAERAARSYHHREPTLVSLLHVSARLTAALKPGDGEIERAPIWSRRAEFREERARSEADLASAVTGFLSVLAIDPGHAPARAGLAELYNGEFTLAELQRDASAMKLNALMVRQFDDTARFTPGLVRQGGLEVETDPPGATVELEEFRESVDGRLIPVPLRVLGKTPLARLVLPAGSYRLVLKRDGEPHLHYPLVIGRASEHRAKVRLKSAGEIGAGFIFIPGGPAPIGGENRNNLLALPPAPVQVDDFCIARVEVTIADYCEFINDLLEQGREDEANLHNPRRVLASPALPLRRGLQVSAPRPEYATWPMFNVTWNGATAFAAWKTARARLSGIKVTYRLPSAAEWEKAARGADERLYPWGSQFDRTFARVGTIGAMMPNGGPVGQFPKDLSPYDVLDMGGSVAEWTSTEFPPTRGKFIKGNGGLSQDPASDAILSASMLSPTDGILLGVGFRLVRVPD